MTWEDTIARVEVRLPFPVRFFARATDRDEVEIRCTIVVPDIHTREPSTVNFQDFITRDLPEVGRIAYLRDLLQRTIDHELDEAFLVDGKQLRNPHIATGEPCPRHANCRITRVRYVGIGDQRFGCEQQPEPA